MIGTDLFKIEVNAELSNERLKSLIFFYEPLIGSDALYTYEFLIMEGNVSHFTELNELLIKLNISADMFEKQCGKLNEYRLLKTLNKDNQYVFEVNQPLTIKQFIEDDLFARDFILKTSGKRYQEILSEVSYSDNYKEFKDVSKTFNAENLSKWSMENETYLNNDVNKDSFNFNTFFNVNTFLKNISTNLLPLRFRTKTNLKQMAVLADLYNISYDKMKSFIPKITKIDSDKFDVDYLKYLCMHTNSDYTKVDKNDYDVPCLTYLMSLQDGKEVTEFDKNIIYKLSNGYNLSPSVINVLLRYCLINCDNRLIEKYIYGIASDFHRNNILTSKQALERLYNETTKKDVDTLPTYDTSVNPDFDENRLKELLDRRKK